MILVHWTVHLVFWAYLEELVLDESLWNLVDNSVLCDPSNLTVNQACVVQCLEEFWLQSSHLLSRQMGFVLDIASHVECVHC